MRYDNPYLREFEALSDPNLKGPLQTAVEAGGLSDGQRAKMAKIARDINAALHRDPMIARWAYAVPNDEAIEALLALGPLVEIGAGRGYWACLLRHAGGDVVAYDVAADGHTVGQWSDGERVPTYTEVLAGDASAAGLHPDRALFLCWAPLNEPMARDALRAHREAGGSLLAHVGEGCTDDLGFREDVDSLYESVSRVQIPRWAGMNDVLNVYRLREFPTR